jgi:hypothetical protein
MMFINNLKRRKKMKKIGKVVYTGNPMGLNYKELKFKLGSSDIVVEGCRVRDERMFVTHIYVKNEEAAKKVEEVLSERNVEYSKDANISYADWGTINICIQGKKMSPGGIASAISMRYDYEHIVT